MSFESDYNDLLKYAKLKVDFGELSIFPEDLINDAYVNLFGQPYSIQAFRKEISNLAIREKSGVKIDQAYKVPKIQGDRVCVTCHELKPAGHYKVAIKANGGRYIYTECQDCVDKKLMDRYKAIKDTPEYKERNKKNFKNHVDKDRKKWNNYLKQRDRKDRDTLSDSYMKKVLKKKYSKQYLIDNPETIIEHRKKIFAKRLAKALK